MPYTVPNPQSQSSQGPNAWYLFLIAAFNARPAAADSSWEESVLTLQHSDPFSVGVNLVAVVVGLMLGFGKSEAKRMLGSIVLGVAIVATALNFITPLLPWSQRIPARQGVGAPETSAPAQSPAASRHQVMSGRVQPAYQTGRIPGARSFFSRAIEVVSAVRA